MNNTMTVKEVANILNVDVKTVRKYVKRFFPDIMEHGKTTYLNEYQVTVVKMNMEKNQHLFRHYNEVDAILNNSDRSVSVNKSITGGMI